MEVIRFEPQTYIEAEKAKMTIEEFEYIGITDINRYKIDVVRTKSRLCYHALKDGVFVSQVLLTKRKFNTAFPTYHDISPEYEIAFSDFMKKQSWVKRQRFNKVSPE